MPRPVPWLRVRAAGVPVPQGSKRAWLNKETGRVHMVEDQGDRHASWRLQMSGAATESLWAAGVSEPTDQPVSVLLTFWMPRGIGHYGSGRNAQVLKPSAPMYPAGRPDIDKLTRAALDSLTDSRVWFDDSQVVALKVRKRWLDRYGAEPPGVEMVVGIMPTGEEGL